MVLEDDRRGEHRVGVLISRQFAARRTGHGLAVRRVHQDGPAADVPRGRPRRRFRELRRRVGDRNKASATGRPQQHVRRAEGPLMVAASRRGGACTHDSDQSAASVLGALVAPARPVDSHNRFRFDDYLGCARSAHATRYDVLRQWRSGDDGIRRALRTGGEARAIHMPRITGKNVTDALRLHADRKSRLHTDESPLYPAVGEEFAKPC